MSNAKSSTTSEVLPHVFEIELFDRLSENPHFKDLKLPYAVLEVSKDSATLGVPRDNAGKLSGNYTDPLLASALTDALKEILNCSHPKFIIKTAEQECREAKHRIDSEIRKRKKAEELARNIERQIENGKCDLKPYPDAEEKIRTPMILESCPIFVVNTYQGNYWKNETEYQDRATKDRMHFKVEVGCQDGVVNGVLKQSHQAALYKMFDLWEEEGFPLFYNGKVVIGYISLSLYKLVEVLTGGTSGKHYEIALRLLKEMDAIRIRLTKSNRTKKISSVEDFTLLTYSTKALQDDSESLESPKELSSQVHIYFSEEITKDFLSKKIKALHHKSYLLLKDKANTGSAELLFGRLNFQLATKGNFHKALAPLFEQIGLSSYRYKSQRKRVMSSVVSRIKRLKDIKMELSFKLLADGKDYALVAKLVE